MEGSEMNPSAKEIIKTYQKIWFKMQSDEMIEPEERAFYHAYRNGEYELILEHFLELKRRSEYIGECY